MLVHEVLSRNMRDRRAVARYADLTGSDESGGKTSRKGLARSATRVRCGMIQLAWRLLMLQKHIALAEWYRQRTLTAPWAEATPRRRESYHVDELFALEHKRTLSGRWADSRAKLFELR